MPSIEDVLTLAWGERDGYVVLSTMDRAKKDDPQAWRDLAFKWPRDRTKVLDRIRASKGSHEDVYFAPAVFSEPKRSRHVVQPTDMLWADLDEADPHNLKEELKPTAAWQTSPGRFQALWRMDRELPPEAQTKLNRRLTYAVGADKGGWDLTQVLRLPGLPNNKYPERPTVKLVWLNGHTLQAAKAVHLLPKIGEADVARDAISDIPDPVIVLRRHRRRLSGRPMSLLRASRAREGTRSERLWELECLLAERGLTVEEIVSLAQSSVWNKFSGRHDEVERLSTEARKAVAKVNPNPAASVPDGVTAYSPSLNGHKQVDDLEDAVVDPVNSAAFDRDRKPIRWLIADVWGEGECGFISGQPKTYKSWVALEFGMSVATASRFMGVFQTRRKNVLIVQEEDPKEVLQDRLAKVAAARDLIRCQVVGDEIEFRYDMPDNLYIISNQGFQIDDEWLDELERWITEKDIGLVILDPLMMMAGQVDEFKAFEMMDRILKPLKRLRARTQASICVVHHHTKAEAGSGAKGMYGTVAFWAWEEAGLHLEVTGPGRIKAERFSKHDLLTPLNLMFGDVRDHWKPVVDPTGAGPLGLLELLSTFEGGATIAELESVTNRGRDALQRELHTLKEASKVEAIDMRGGGRQGRRPQVWRVVKEE